MKKKEKYDERLDEPYTRQAMKLVKQKLDAAKKRKEGAMPKS